MEILKLQQLKLELAVKSKKGADFILAASIIWFGIAIIWSLSSPAYQKSVVTFIVGSALLPLAFILSKILKTNWKVKNNPLQPLGLWFNFAQLFYFPFLIFILLKSPDYFVMTYAIITGAHLFPYAWLYDEIMYAVTAGVISVITLILALNMPLSLMYFVPLSTALVLLFLFLWLIASLTKQKWKNKTR